MIDLDQLIVKAYDLEPLPASVTRLSALVADNNSQINDIVEVLAFDPALTAGILRSANSAASASSTAISSVKDAVLRMGLGTVLALTVAASVKRNMIIALPEYGLRENELWRHSVLSSLSVEAIQAHSKVQIQPDAFTAALLHDIGKLVLSRFLDADVQYVMQLAHDEGRLETPAAESEILGVNHGEVGGLMAQHWKLPESIVRGISYHHNPAEGGDTICYVVALANLTAHRIADKSSDDQGLLPPKKYLERMGLTTESFEKVCETASKRMDDVQRRYNA